MNNHEQRPQSFNDLERWLNQRRVTEIECLVPRIEEVESDDALWVLKPFAHAFNRK